MYIYILKHEGGWRQLEFLTLFYEQYSSGSQVIVGIFGKGKNPSSSIKVIPFFVHWLVYDETEFTWDLRSLAAPAVANDMYSSGSQVIVVIFGRGKSFIFMTDLDNNYFLHSLTSIRSRTLSSPETFGPLLPSLSPTTCIPPAHRSSWLSLAREIPHFPNALGQ